MTGVGAGENRVLCGFPNPCGRVLGVHGDGSVHVLRRRLALEPGRADLAERRMSTTLVVEHLNVVEQRHLGVAVKSSFGTLFVSLVPFFRGVVANGSEERLATRSPVKLAGAVCAASRLD
jgi:hypothetical protein